MLLTGFFSYSTVSFTMDLHRPFMMEETSGYSNLSVARPLLEWHSIELSDAELNEMEDGSAETIELEDSEKRSELIFVCFKKR